MNVPRNTRERTMERLMKKYSLYLAALMLIMMPGCSDDTTGNTNTGTKCGNGFIEDSEQCDDENNVNNDGCDDNCHIEQGWTCSTDGCIQQNTCGNGKFDDGEECDDKNDDPNDGGELCDPPADAPNPECNPSTCVYFIY